MWETGESRTLCGNLLSSIPYHSRALTGRLKGAWRLYQLWGQKEIPARAPPLSKVAAFAIAHQFYRWGFRNVSIVLVLAFYRFLRTGEFFALRAGQFAFGEHMQDAHITFPQTKSSQLKGILESVHVDDPHLVKALHHLTRYLNPGDPLLLMSPKQFQTDFRQACMCLRLCETSGDENSDLALSTARILRCHSRDALLELSNMADTTHLCCLMRPNV